MNIISSMYYFIPIHSQHFNILNMLYMQTVQPIQTIKQLI